VLIAPAVLALNGLAVSVTLLMVLASGFALSVIRYWDIASGSERQVALERRTYLISTLVTWCFVVEILSLLLFVYNAEQMSTQFVGAMCATGVINADPLGWPALWLKIAVFFAGAGWLMLNRIDNKAPEYPLIRIKYGFLLALTPLVAAEAVVQLGHFLGLRPDVITSCCGALFTSEGEGVAGTLSALEPGLALAAMSLAGGAALGAGLGYLLRHKGGGALAFAVALAFVTAIVGVVSFVALYVYEHPHHHCPFCILKSGHGLIGYWLYVPLFAASALALGVGLISRWRTVPSLTAVIDAEGRRGAALAMGLLAIFYVVSAYAVLSSNLTLEVLWW